ncbi:unnamed protein product [Acanthosepion pharaonis]|uniref:Uncharacterized protein n=1 Tax=Acanthosepion pharaonis TaxID=158019 RepID=A0A812DZS5_ACAPH|nr:unnamed protein product [Sepia pharaonis]
MIGPLSSAASQGGRFFFILQALFLASTSFARGGAVSSFLACSYSFLPSFHATLIFNYRLNSLRSLSRLTLTQYFRNTNLLFSFCFSSFSILPYHRLFLSPFPLLRCIYILSFNIHIKLLINDTPSTKFCHPPPLSLFFFLSLSLFCRLRRNFSCPLISMSLLFLFFLFLNLGLLTHISQIQTRDWPPSPSAPVSPFL